MPLRGSRRDSSRQATLWEAFVGYAVTGIRPSAWWWQNVATHGSERGFNKGSRHKKVMARGEDDRAIGSSLPFYGVGLMGGVAAANKSNLARLSGFANPSKGVGSDFPCEEHSIETRMHTLSSGRLLPYAPFVEPSLRPSRGAPTLRLWSPTSRGLIRPADSV